MNERRVIVRHPPGEGNEVGFVELSDVPSGTAIHSEVCGAVKEAFVPHGPFFDVRLGIASRLAVANAHGYAGQRLGDMPEEQLYVTAP